MRAAAVIGPSMTRRHIQASCKHCAIWPTGAMDLRGTVPADMRLTVISLPFLALVTACSDYPFPVGEGGGEGSDSSGAASSGPASTADTGAPTPCSTATGGDASGPVGTGEGSAGTGSGDSGPVDPPCMPHLVQDGEMIACWCGHTVVDPTECGCMMELPNNACECPADAQCTLPCVAMGEWCYCGFVVAPLEFCG